MEVVVKAGMEMTLYGSYWWFTSVPQLRWWKVETRQLSGDMDMALYQYIHGDGIVPDLVTNEMVEG